MRPIDLICLINYMRRVIFVELRGLLIKRVLINLVNEISKKRKKRRSKGKNQRKVNTRE